MSMLEIFPKSDIKMINESLSRMGIADRKNKILYPTCLLYKTIDSKYYICHFKELFLLRPTKPSYDNITDMDILRRNSIALLLEDWGLLDILDFPEETETVFVYTLPHSEKRNWLIKQKFNLNTLN